MPFGRYTILGDDGGRVGTEEFRSAPGPMGWRYVAEIETTEPDPHRERLDLAVDADWRIVNVRIATDSHDIELRPNENGSELTGRRDGEPVAIAYGRDVHLDYFTPATNAITLQRLEGTSEIDVVYLEPVTLEPTRVRQRYERIGDERVGTPAGLFEAVRWRFTALDTGWSEDLWIAAQTVVRYERLFDLASLEPGASGPWPIAGGASPTASRV